MTAQSTILVVEDEDSFVDALTVGLKREGFRVSVARDGAEAIEIFDDGAARLGVAGCDAAQDVGHRCLS